MSQTHTKGSSASFGSVVEVLAVLAMVFAVLAIIAPLIGGNGLRFTDRPDGTNAMMTIVGSPSSEFGVDLGDPLPKSTDDDGVTSVFGQPVVEVGEPLTITASMLDPTPSQRVIWLVWQVSGPLLVLLIAWPIRQMARSSKGGDPFTAENERRLWSISGLVIVGGIVVSFISGAAQTIIMGRSAAADLFTIQFEVSFAPIFIGLVIAALASIWHHGVAMRDELEATI